ncbi:hypothetical protein [Pseudomarimonas salicorniae]|uniref:Uncharacterized protein n=1 Tax=Pseudomarimonas salicorniae TaxID=2933270 RepID=A0ABT0GET4_9GAMM|nr:hypothetical protein [Lysobacter sp. CAU 1642]MCK7593060.1 hypothetical protein [Lysobacter sp. CAU 1642]
MYSFAKSRCVLPLSLLTLAVLSSAALAQNKLDTQSLADPEIRVLSCAQVDIGWNIELIQQYPHIADACHEVVTNQGKKWARFEADFLRVNRDGSVTSEFVDRRGRAVGRYTLIPGKDQQVTLNGQKRPFSALRTNERISLYVPEGAAALSSEPVVAPERYSQIVRYEPVGPTPAPVQLAAASPARQITRLPDTAGPLPWLALGSGAFALLALGVRRMGN